jgi:hypothetical protein
MGYWTDLDEHSAAGWAEAQYEEREALLDGATECEWCGEDLKPGEGNVDVDGEVVCDACHERLGFADVDEHKAERQQMGLVDF